MINQIKACIEQIRVRPGMYIGEKNITYLSRFLCGVEFSLRQNQIPENQYLPELPFFLFHEYAARHYGDSSASKGYARIILEHCDFDEEKALGKFFELYASFCKIKAEKIWRADVTNSNQCYYKVQLDHDMGYILIIVQDGQGIIEHDVIAFNGFFVQDENAVDRWTNQRCKKTICWCEEAAEYIYAEKGFCRFGR